MAEARRARNTPACSIPPRSGRASTSVKNGSLQQALESLVDRPQDEVIRRVAELEAQHAERRAYPWQKLGLSPLATALEPLAQLAGLCQSAPGAPTPEAYAASYASDGWRVDAAALATMAACGSPEQHAAVLGTLRAVYLPWLENTARHLQQLIRDNGQSVSKRAKPIEAAAGRLVVVCRRTADGRRPAVGRETGGGRNRIHAGLGVVGHSVGDGHRQARGVSHRRRCSGWRGRAMSSPRGWFPPGNS